LGTRHTPTSSSTAAAAAAAAPAAGPAATAAALAYRIKTQCTRPFSFHCTGLKESNGKREGRIDKHHKCHPFLAGKLFSFSLVVIV
jgi:hypothetical protein